MQKAKAGLQILASASRDETKDVVRTIQSVLVGG